MNMGGVIALIALVVLGMGGIAWGGATGWTFSATGAESDPAKQAAACGIDTLATVNLVDKYSGDAVETPTLYIKRAEKKAVAFTSGTTKLSPGEGFELLASKTDYIDSVKSVKGSDIKCGGSNVIEMDLYPTSTIGLRIKNDDGDFVTDNAAGGATNQTDLNLGERLQVELEIAADSDEFSGDLVIVVELSETANVTSIEMSGASKVATPSFYSNTLSSPKVQAFEVDGVTDNAKAIKTITAEAKSGKDIQGAVYVTAYSLQHFKEKSGSFEKAVENIDGDSKYEDLSDVDFYVN